MSFKGLFLQIILTLGCLNSAAASYTLECKNVFQTRSGPETSRASEKAFKRFSDFDLFQINSGLQVARLGSFNLPINKSVKREWLANFRISLQNYYPSAMAILMPKIQQGEPLEEGEARRLTLAVYSHFREVQHLYYQSQKVESMDPERAIILWDAMAQSQPRAKIWLELGWKPKKERGLFEYPTIFQLAQSLAKIQDRMGTPKHLRVNLTQTHMEPYESVYQFYSLAEKLPSGHNIPINIGDLPTKAFNKALNKGLVPINLMHHDLGHAVIWTLHPQFFDAARNISRIAEQNENDFALQFRSVWVVEGLALPHNASHLLTSHVWQQGSKNSVEENWQAINDQINNYSLGDLIRYAESQLIPGYRNRYEPYGGAHGQWGEMVTAWTHPERQLERFYEDQKTVRSSDGKYPYSGRDVYFEQPSNLGAELEVLIENKILDPMLREQRIRNTIARMELAIGEQAQINALQVVDLFLAPQDIRRNSRLAKVIKILRGEHSTLYRVLVD